MPACKLNIEGQVQGVGFRAFVADLAMRHGLRGEVWNSNSGGVRAVLVADDQAVLDRAIPEIRKGPGRIDTIRQSSFAGASYTDFRVTATRRD